MKSLDPIQLIKQFYRPGSLVYRILLIHSHHVATLAVEVAQRVIADGTEVDQLFVRQAALLHDIGIITTDAPDIGCFGNRPYLCHGIEGRKLLEEQGYPRHAVVCERHTGVGLTAEEIVRQQLPLPQRDMVPLTVEEEIIAYADLFYSKNPDRLRQKKTPQKIRRQLERFGQDKVGVFDRWHQRFSRDKKL